MPIACRVERTLVVCSRENLEMPGWILEDLEMVQEEEDEDDDEQVQQATDIPASTTRQRPS